MLAEKDDYFSQCKPLIDDIETGKKVAVVPYVVILETIHTLRSKFTQELEFKGGSRELCNANITIVEGIIRKFLKKITDFSKDGKIMIPWSKIAISDHHAEVLKKIKNYFGYIRVMGFCPYCEDGHVSKDTRNQCPKCNCERESIRRYSYKGLGHVDMEHAYFAKRNNVKDFYSSDTSFQNLQGDDDFRLIQFHIIQHPSKLISGTK